MEVDNVVNPSEINSFVISEIRRADVIDLNKKRKLQAEHFGLPIAKLKCSDGSFPSKSLSTLDEIPEVVHLHTNVTKGGATNDGFEHGSANSNSYAEDSDSSMSVHGECKAENCKSWSYDGPSSSSCNWASSSFKCPSYCSDSEAATEGGSGKVHITFVGEEHQTAHDIDDLDEHITEGSHDEYLCSEYGHVSTEHFTDKKREETLHSNEGNQNIFVLSSGRWSLNQERGKRKPTIDQEFEQYFSLLML